MPPARGKAKRTGVAVGPSKAEVKPNDLEDVMKNLLDNQRTALNSSESHVDVVLILQDGVIPVHGVLLEAVSPFFRACFESQGPYYFGTREVILPDYNIKTMQKVIQLIYNKSVYCQKESETKEVEEAIKDLGIELTSSLETVKVAKPEDQKEVKFIAPIVYQCVKEQKTVFKPKTYMDSNGKAIPLKDMTIDVTSPTNRGIAGQAYVPRPKVPLIPRIQPRIMPEESSSGEDTGTDKGIKEKTMSSPAWYIRKAKHCQKCKKDYPTAGEASTCLTSHNRLRCYFCFRVCKNTEMLFQHFGRAHRKGGREGFVTCPCCEQSIPFKAVSCHVISMHLTEGGNKSQQPGRANHRYRPVYKTPLPKGDNGHAAKKPKLDELKVGDLDCDFRMERENGSIWLFNVKKEREYE